jgi:flagellar biosynthetic protein FlhB|tara:strand:- start:1630 stop:2781 length:1152 start_codon:yes stop_codon:yes gene_type:complete
MAENDQTQEKTQEPTQRRLEKAREDGDILSSKEMFVFASSAVGLLVIAVLGFFATHLLTAWSTLFTFSHPEDLFSTKFYNSWQSFKLIISGAAIFAIPSFVGIILMQTVVGSGISFSSKALGFKWNKLDPIKGLGKIFSVKGLAELIKSIAKVVFLTGLVLSFLWFTLPNLMYLSAGLLNQSLEILYRSLLTFIFVIVLVLFAIGVGDYLWSRHTWLEKLRMSRQDLKEESKESEGSPEVKARMRRLQMEASQRAAEQAQAINDVKDASVVITNPTHFAVAIKYQPNQNDAPIIVAMGKDSMALRVIEEAESNSVSVVRSPLLARALFYTGGIGHAISEQLYSAVASILAYVYQLERGVSAALQDPEIPSDFIFDEFGKPTKE